jgi:hypothetical protein
MAKILETETWLGVDFGEPVDQEKYGLPSQD